VWNSPRERTCLEERRHGIVLARPFGRALALGAFGAGLSWIGGPLAIPGALVLAGAAFVAVRAAWAWESTPERESLVTVEFKPSGNGTELVLTHEQFADSEARDKHQHGWNGCMDRLGRYLSR